LNGNEINNGAGRVTALDALNRPIKITIGTNVTEFVYNGLGQRVQEKLNGTLVKQWVWDGGAQPAEERNASNVVTKRFFGGAGEQIAGANYYFAKDHLGSVREMTDSTGAIRARYDYDPYGRITKVSGDLESDFGFTGFYRHQATGLNLTITRAYDADLGRWTSRDTISELGGVNLYTYVGNGPINRIDKDGRFWWVAIGAAIGGTVSAIENYADYRAGNISGLQYAELIGVGAAGGALSTLAPGILSGAVLGAVMSGSESLADNAIKGEGLDFAAAGEEAAFGIGGGLLSGVSGAVGKDIIYVPEQIGKVVGSNSSLVKDLEKVSGIGADLFGDWLKHILKSKEKPCRHK
jgi:RHS repeat-associated protein